MVDGGNMTEQEQKDFDNHKSITDSFNEKEDAKTNEAESKAAAALKEKDPSSLTPEEKEKIKGYDTKKKESKDKKEADSKSALEKAEDQAKKDEKILDTPEDELDEVGKARKAEILASIKEKEDNKSPEDKEKGKLEKEKKENQTKLDKRFGDLTGQLKDLKRDKSADKEKIAILEKELADVKDKLNPEKINEAKKAEEARISKYLEEDKDKPREQKREMSKEDLEEWLLDDIVEANEWMVERSARRSAERNSLANQETQKKNVAAFVALVSESSDKVEKKHPELNTKARIEELKKDKPDITDGELHEVLCKENEKYRTMSEIMKADPSKYWGKNAPELMMVEMEKRLGLKDKEPGKEDNKDKTYTAAEIEDIKKEAIEAEEERKNNIDEGIESTKAKETAKGKTYDAETEKKIAKICKISGISRKDFDGSVEHRKKLGIG